MRLLSVVTCRLTDLGLAVGFRSCGCHGFPAEPEAWPLHERFGNLFDESNQWCFTVTGFVLRRSFDSVEGALMFV